MTIKQHGGIFGRNPTFNEVGGTLTTAAQPNITSLGTQSSNLAFASGNGIDFSATGDGSGTDTSELFDDYEEGTFTPVIEGSTGNPTLTYAAQTGVYTRVGRVVTVNCAVQPSVVSVAGSGNLQISGLPYASANIADTHSTGVASTNGNFNWGTNKTQLVFYIGPNSSKIAVNGMQNSTAEAAVPVTNLSNSAKYLFFSITYTAA